MYLGEKLAAKGISFVSANRRGPDIVTNGRIAGEPQGYAFE